MTTNLTGNLQQDLAQPKYVHAAVLRKQLGGICRQTLTRMVRDGTLPSPIKLGQRTVLFEMAEVRQYLDRCKTGGNV
jgi:predicted DNA-binding transcriptional regulator AlpA